MCVEAKARGGRWPITVDSCFLPTKACCHVLIYTTTDKAIAAIASPFFLFITLLQRVKLIENSMINKLVK